MKNLIRTTLFITSLLCCIALNADTLQASHIKKWIKAYPTVDAWMEDHEELIDAAVEKSTIGQQSIDEMMKSAFEAIKSLPVYGDLQKLVKPLGYASAETFMEDTYQIVKTYGAMAIKQELMDNEEFDLEAIKAQLQQIEQMQGIPEEQKEMMKAQFQQAMGGLTNMLASFESVSDEDINAMKHFMIRSLNYSKRMTTTNGND